MPGLFGRHQKVEITGLGDCELGDAKSLPTRWTGETQSTVER